MDYYTTLKRSMFKAHKEIGAMPFLLFEYYLTYETASEGIKPSLKTVAEDLGLEPNAVCNLRKRLVEAGWIKYENGQVIILKTFTPSETPSHHVNKTFTPSEQTFTPSEVPYIRTENKQEIKKEKTKNIVADKPQPPAAKESDLSLLQKQEFTEGMSFLKTKIGKYPDGGAQGKSLKWMLQNGASILQIRRGLERQIAEYQGRYRASYLTLSKDIFRWIEETNGEILINGKISNANNRGTQTDKQIESGKRLDAIIADADRFQSPLVN